MMMNIINVLLLALMPTVSVALYFSPDFHISMISNGLSQLFTKVTGFQISINRSDTDIPSPSVPNQPPVISQSPVISQPLTVTSTPNISPPQESIIPTAPSKSANIKVGSQSGGEFARKRMEDIKSISNTVSQNPVQSLLLCLVILLILVIFFIILSQNKRGSPRRKDSSSRIVAIREDED